MNKYHKHQSKGLARPNYQAIGQLRCPVTGKLIDGHYAFVVFEPSSGKILSHDEESNNAKTYSLHMHAFLNKYKYRLEKFLGVQA